MRAAPPLQGIEGRAAQVNHLIISFEIEFLDESSYVDCRRKITDISFMLSALHNAQLARARG